MTVTGNNSVGLMWQTVSYASVETVTVSVSASSGDFADMIAQKLNSRLNTSASSETADSSASTVESRSSDMTADGKRTDSISQTDKPVTERTEDDRMSATDATGSTDAASDLEEMSQEDVEKLCEQVMDVISSLLSQFAQMLEVTVDELQGAFEQINIDVTQVIDSKSLSQLVLNLNGAQDISSMLTDSSMLESFTELKELTADILEEAGLDPESFKSIVSSEQFAEYAASDAELKNTAAGQLIEKLTAKADGQENTELQPKSDMLKEISVTYTEIRSSSSEGGRNEFTSDSDQDASSSEHTEKSSSAKTALPGREHFAANAESFIGSLENAVREAPVAETINTMGTTVREIVYQLVDSIKVSISTDNTSLEMQLNPESLGKVQLNISSKDGVMTAHITTESQAAREAVQSQLQILKDTITEQGIKVDAIEVTVSDFSFAGSTNAGHSFEAEGQEKGSRSGNRINGTASAAASEETAQEHLKDSPIGIGNTVDYVA